MSCSYSPKESSTSNHNAELSKSIDLLTSKYEHILFFGDFSASMEDASMKLFCSNYNLLSMRNKQHPTKIQNMILY